MKSEKNFGTTIEKAEQKRLLSEIFKNINSIDIPKDAKITNITCDSRNVSKDSLFAAFKGSNIDGSLFIDDAVAAGASVLLCDKDSFVKEYDDVVILRHDNPRWVFSKIAAGFYPNQPKNIVSVTGTNGKTSVVHFCRQIWQLLGQKAACLGTTGVVVEDGDLDGTFSQSLTTPDPMSLHKTLSDVANRGVDFLAIEASSHGLDQYRLDGINIKSAAFTNLTHDHLDYHGDLSSYFNAKARLFNSLLNAGSMAVLNADIGEYHKLVQICRDSNLNIISVGSSEGADLRIIDIEPTNIGQIVKISFAGQAYDIEVNLVGSFQIFNLLQAAILVSSSGFDLDDIFAVLPDIKSVPGRMQRVYDSNIYVDYAHTPDALEHALTVLKQHCKGNLKLVFGCGGDRDKDKRPKMGYIASKYADDIIVTDDNPRGEDPEVIRNEIIAVCRGKNVKDIGDRKAAIVTAIESLKSDDILLIAGKGHEKTQKIGDQLLPFDDVEVARDGFGS